MIRRVVVALALFAAVSSAEDAPQWFMDAARREVPKYGPKVGAVVLQNDVRVLVEEGGRITTTRDFAVRVLTREGRDQAIARQLYTTSGGKVKQLRAWMKRPSGEIKKYGKDETLDIALTENDVYNESRVRAIVGSADAEPGAVFGYESVLEEKTVFLQDEFYFQDRLPVLTARYAVTVPSGWRAEGIVYNCAMAKPEVAGATSTWAMHDAPPIEDEPASPSFTVLAPRLDVSFMPPDGARTGLGKSFSSWGDVAGWLSEIADPQMTTSGDLIEKAESLTAGAATDFDKVRAIGRYVQAVRYVAIQTGLGRGGGYRPHPAAEVFAKGYGDCKDKANLMRTMLKAVGVEAYPVVISADDRERVRDEWPSPQQFNHCILAARLKDPPAVSALVKDSELGEILLFDPTDEHTAPGDLPRDEENSLALVVSPRTTSLLKVPVSEPEQNRIEREVEASLQPNGGVRATVREHGLGHAAVDLRRQKRQSSESEYRRRLERWVSGSMPGAVISKANTEEQPVGAKFELDMELSAERYAQSMQGRLLIFRPSILDRRDQVFLTEANRKNPVVLEAESFRETAHITLPQGFEIDEIGAGFELETPFATYRGKCEPKEGALDCVREMKIQSMTVKPDQYKAVRDFFSRVAGYEQSPVVLARD